MHVCVQLTAPALLGIGCADALGAAVLHYLCQKEAQDAIDPTGIAVNKLGFLLIHVGSGKSLLVLPRKVLHWRER